MSKIGIILAREYKTRVMKKSFILLTFLVPVLFVGISFIPALLSNVSESSIKNIIVIDKTGLYGDALKDSDGISFIYSNAPVNNRKKNSEDKNNEFTAVLEITGDLSKNPTNIKLYAEKSVGVDLKSLISNELSQFIQKQKLQSYNIPNIAEIIKNSKPDIEITTIKWNKKGKEETTSTELSLIIGLVSAILIYMLIVIYGAQVMTGVVQEKTSRIVEVMISSVKPFDLMMGKIIGIALVGLTQFLMWLILSGVLLSVFAVFSGIANPAFFQNIDLKQFESGITQLNSHAGINISGMFTSLLHINLFQLVGLFIIYFLGGYMLYASLFAAVGSAIDNETDNQQFTLPITIPILISMYIAIYAAQSPDSSLAFWSSIIPISSPVVMMARLPYGVPAWQIILSVFILIISFIFTVWLAGKIYRTGILMYGKKVTWKEIVKWVKYK